MSSVCIEGDQHTRSMQSWCVPDGFCFFMQAGAVASLQQELAAAQQAAATATAAEEKVAAKAAHVKERFEVEAEKRNK